WERFCVTLKKNVVILLVQVFYDALRDEETGRPNSVHWNTVTVRGKDVPFDSKTICEFYNAPYYETDFLENKDLNQFEDLKWRAS
ncbi:hypothetical protein Goari_016692, partial [Gossypium aridum]|nr:hypothetical protein [Gossypium aridum]